MGQSSALAQIDGLGQTAAVFCLLVVVVLADDVELSEYVHQAEIEEAEVLRGLGTR